MTPLYTKKRGALLSERHRTCEKVRGSKEHLETKAHPEAASAPLPRLIFRPPDAGARLPCCARAIADMTMAKEQKAVPTGQRAGFDVIPAALSSPVHGPSPRVTPARRLSRFQLTP